MSMQEQLHTLAQISAIFRHLHDKRHWLAELTRRVAEMLDAEQCVAILRHEADGDFRPQWPAYGVDRRQIESIRFPVEQPGGLLQRIPLHGALIIEDVHVDAQLHAAVIDEWQEHNLLIARLQVDDRILGGLRVANKRSGAFTETDAALLGVVANQTALALEHYQAYTAQVQVETALKQSEARYRDLYENAPIAYFSVGIDGRIRRCNRRAEQLLGFTAQELGGRPILDLYADTVEGKEKAQAILERFHAGQSVRNEELQMQRADGTHVWVSLTLNAIRDAQGEIVAGRSMVVDISEQKHSEQALRASQAMLAEAEDIAHLGSWDWDLGRGHLIWSDEMFHIWGLEDRENPLSTDEIASRIHPEDRESVARSVQTALQGSGRFDSQHRIVRPDGEVRHVHVRARIVFDELGQPVRMVGSAQDITEQIQTREVLQNYTQRLEILRQLDQAIVATQSPQAIAQAAMQRIRDLLPCQLANVMRFDWEREEAHVLAFWGTDPLQGKDRLPLREYRPFDELQRGQIRITESLHRLTAPSSHLRALLQTGIRSAVSAPLMVEGELIGALNLLFTTAEAAPDVPEIAAEVADVLAIALQQARLHEELQRYAAELEERVALRTAELQEQVTEVEQLNRALTNLLEDLQAANRRVARTILRLEKANAELESFTYSVSHDLRAPLRAMQGFAGALLEDYGDRFDDLGREYARRIVDSAQHMDTLINDLLAYSRLGRMEIRLQPQSLERVVERVVAELQAEIEPRQADIRVEHPLPAVLGHEMLLIQVLSNLTANALKFVAPGVRPQVRIRAEEQNDRVRLWVEDNGIGIAPEHQERIFRIFERLHGIETYPGTGIGLALVKKAADRLNGAVGLESAVGQGSRFWVELRKA